MCVGGGRGGGGAIGSHTTAIQLVLEQHFIQPGAVVADSTIPCGLSHPYGSIITHIPATHCLY